MSACSVLTVKAPVSVINQTNVFSDFMGTYMRQVPDAEAYARMLLMPLGQPIGSSLLTRMPCSALPSFTAW